jgi:hypothetical protein
VPDGKTRELVKVPGRQSLVNELNISSQV